MSYFSERNISLKIKNIKIKNDCYINCKSVFYFAQNSINQYENYEFFIGINKLLGEIDSGNWGISYLISMYPYLSYLDKKLIFQPPNAIVNNETLSLIELAKHTCYMDRIYPLFSKKKAVRTLVTKGLEKYHSKETAENIRDMFHIDPERFERPLSGIGNEIFKAMAAIGFSHEKQVFCFPWLSKMRFEYYHGNITDVLNVLESWEKIIILPVGK